MNAKQIKRARALAYKEATRRGLWKEGEASLFSKWWRKLLAKFFPKIRKRYADMIGRWYRANLKVWAHKIAALTHDRYYQDMQKARRRLTKSRKYNF